MPLIKGTLNLSELQALLKDTQAPIAGIFRFLEGKKVKKALKVLDAHKTQGFDAQGVLQLLLLKPLLGVPTVNAFFESAYSSLSQAQKDVYYRLANDPRIDWRSLLYGFAKHFLSMSDAPEPAKAKPTCMILDDTIGGKTGRRIEGVGKLFDHVSGGYVLGHKDLVLGYWDTTSLIPLDFSMHRELGKNKKKPYGLDQRIVTEQFTKERPQGSPGSNRRGELDTTKMASALKMLKRAAKHGVKADYLLLDSWFVNDGLIKFVAASKHVGHLLGQCKNDGRKYVYDGREYSGKQLKNMLSAQWKRARTLKMRYLQVDVTYKGVPMRLFFTRQHGVEKERLLVTTDMGLSFPKAYEIYAIRWSIEVFFKEAKQLLGLGKCQSSDFDGQIAAATICMMQYVTLAHEKRMRSYKTLGGLFRDCKQQATEALLSQRIWRLVLALLIKLSRIVPLDMDQTMERFFNEEGYDQEMMDILGVLMKPKGDKAKEDLIFDKSA